MDPELRGQPQQDDIETEGDEDHSESIIEEKSNDHASDYDDEPEGDEFWQGLVDRQVAAQFKALKHLLERFVQKYEQEKQIYQGRNDQRDRQLLAVASPRCGLASARTGAGQEQAKEHQLKIEELNRRLEQQEEQARQHEHLMQTQEHEERARRVAHGAEAAVRGGTEPCSR
ncbi:hypothetical protein BGZ82_010731 [Podila clonocystis]|nr:hypothetical protein BGZ82_010731 [Podila clonocystis]